MKDPNAPPAPDPRIGQFMDTAMRLHAQAANLAPPNYPGMSLTQALVGVAGALATARNPHAQFVAGYLPALGQAVQRQYGNSEQAWQTARQNLVDQANLYQQRAAGIQQWQEDMYKAQMGVYGQQVRGVGAAQVRADSAGGPAAAAAPPVATPPADPAAARKALLRSRGVPDDVASTYLPGVSRLPDGEAASWVGNQAAADQLIGQAGKVANPLPGHPFDLGGALFTIHSIGSAADTLRAQVASLRAARNGLVANMAAVDPASAEARNLQAGIDQYAKAIQANGAQLDRLAGASKQVSDSIARRSAAMTAPPALPAPPLQGSIGPGSNAVNIAARRPGN
jgi:hypothetical protein